MAKQERGLGKGLSALLGSDADAITSRRPVRYINPTASVKAAPEGTICNIPVDEISPNPFQPRITFDPVALEELSSSIKALGLIQPITVRRIADGKFQIVSGERRWRACRAAGMSSIPAYVRSGDDVAMLEMAIVENIQRMDLDPIETALSLNRLINECNLTQEQMASRIGKSRVAVTNSLRLLRLPAKVQYDVKVGNISVGHAKVLLGVEDASLQEKLTDEIIRDGLSVRALELRVKAIAREGKGQGSRPSSQNLPDSYVDVASIVGKFFDNKITVKRSSLGKGSLSIHFTSDSQVEAFLEALKAAKL